jgi:E3 ubiquitin-protein ligase synoviolin
VNADANHEDEEQRRRRAEEAMEQMLLAQEAAEARELEEDGEDDMMIPNEGFEDEPIAFPEDQHEHADDPFQPLMLDPNQQQYQRKAPSYIQTSFAAAFGLIYYALRTRQQWYLALVYLSSSKWAYIVLGNALVASLIALFQFFTRFFMNGLRLAEAEGLGDFFRWNITETCLALTMFRSELNVQTGILFLMLVLSKCLHWVADMREGHLRMTEEAVMVNPDTGRLGLRWPHFQLLLCLVVLQLVDVLAVVQCGHDILQRGPSVSILFAFEGAILLVSVISNILLWHLHVVDGLLHYLHETMGPNRAMHRWIHPWKDHKATLIFAVEVQAQAAKFLFYVTFFAIVMTYYGMPINLFREVYMSFQALKQRLVAFGKYRQLMASMNRFATPTEEELAEDPSCIICRDEMTVDSTKKLPGCGHLFHKSCLREWLVQQQSCPTCRGDISAMEVRQQQQDRADQERAAREEEELQQEAAAEAQEREETLLEGEETTTTSREVIVEGGDASLPPPHDQQRKAPPPSQESTTFSSISPGMTTSANTAPPARSSMIRFSEDEDDDEGTQTRPPTREKRVRIAAPPPGGNDPNSNVFPAFYRAVQDHGASVYNNGSAVSFVIREVPFGVIVLGQELTWRECDGENRLMVRIPDGWVREEELERIVAVPAR